MRILRTGERCPFCGQPLQQTDPEYLEFTIVSVQRSAYRCHRPGEKELFWWPVWDKQPHYGYLEDGCTPVRFYVQNTPVPPPYEGEPSLSPYGLRCGAEIDSAVLLLQNPDAFAPVAAEPDLYRRDSAVTWERPTVTFFEKGGCPFCQGKLLFGSNSAVLCEAVRPQLHRYVGIKFCEEGRKIYCPIWKAKDRQ